MRASLSYFNRLSLVLGFAFLYLPILFLIVFSFNNSRLVSVWGGFSTKWYGTLLSNQALLDAAWTSIKIAVLSATIATILGTMAALAFSHFKTLRARILFSSILFGPLVMPEVITGLSFLLFFVSVDVSRGFFTVVFSHITFSICFVVLIVQSRLISFDCSLEEAAMDLGATPLKTFFYITFPLIFPAVLSGWILAFTLSLDDLVIANFTSGPSATTLPMKIYSQARLGVTPEVNAICTILIALVAFLVIVANVLNTRGTKYLKSDQEKRKPIL